MHLLDLPFNEEGHLTVDPVASQAYRIEQKITELQPLCLSYFKITREG